MRGVVLAGGLGTRLKPLTDITNKHLLPVFDRPMVFYPLQTLADAGITEVMVVVGGQSTGELVRLIGDGSRFGFKRLYYSYQAEEGGIAAALALTEEFAGDDTVAVILGDNLFGGSLCKAFKDFRGHGARVFLAHVDDPSQYGCPEMDVSLDLTRGRIVRIVEKPLMPPSDYAVTGLYLYDFTIYDRIRRLVRSPRGELEVTDLNNSYAAEGKLAHTVLNSWWADAGESVEALLAASARVKESR